jgi:tetratricopeptide (TPR) repeat protein
MLPTFVLYGLLAAAANKKCLYPWQDGSGYLTEPSQDGTRSTVEEESIARGNSRPLAGLIGQCMISILVPCTASGLINLCNANTNWGRYLPQVLTLEVPMGILSGLLIAYLLEVALYLYATSRSLKKAALSAGPLFNSFMIAWFLMLLLPALQLAMYYHSLGAAIDDADALREFLSGFIALSTIPISAAGLAIALARSSRSALVLRVGFLSFTGICLMSSMYFLWNPSIAYLCRAHAKHITGPPSDVIDDCTTAIKLNPNMALAYNARGWTYSMLGNQKQALSDCSTSISLDPKQPEFYALRADIYGKMGAYKQAVSDSSEAILIRPRFVYYLQRAKALTELHQYDDALADCNRAINLRPESSHGYVIRANNYIKCWQFDRAFADLTHAIALNPTHPHAYTTRADVYEKTGRSHLAQVDRQKAAELVSASKETDN